MTDKKPKDVGQSEVQANMDEDTDKGYHGSTPDKTPNENYSVAGVLAGKPTPENNEGKTEAKA